MVKYVQGQGGVPLYILFFAHIKLELFIYVYYAYALLLNYSPFILCTVSIASKRFTSACICFTVYN